VLKHPHVFVHQIDRTGLRAHLEAGEPWQPGLLQLHDPQRMQIHRGYRTREARARLHQAGFAALVLRAYDERCAICNLPRVQMLVEAAHIRPDRDELGLPVVNNGLALCTLHHRAFDAHLLGLRPDGVVHISPRLLAERDGPVLEHGIKAFHQRPLRSPLRSADQPGPEYLAWRWEVFQQAQRDARLSP
jgi:putative restriction endonuclease